METKIYSFRNGVLQFDEVMKLNKSADIYLYSMDKELSKDEIFKMLGLEKAEIKGYGVSDVGLNGVADKPTHYRYEIFLDNPTEKDFNDSLLTYAKESNERTKTMTREIFEKYGLNISGCLTSLTPLFVSENWSVDKNLKNLCIIFGNNYADALHMEAKGRINDRATESFFKEKGLLEEYRDFKMRIETEMKKALTKKS